MTLFQKKMIFEDISAYFGGHSSTHNKNEGRAFLPDQAAASGRGPALSPVLDSITGRRDADRCGLSGSRGGRLSVGLAGKDDNRVTLLSHSPGPDTSLLCPSD